ncbi:MAG: omptin family outer membrane protease [Desulfomonile sp.]|jgi:hypothetical protein
MGVGMRLFRAVSCSVVLIIFVLAPVETQGFDGSWLTLEPFAMGILNEGQHQHYGSIGARKYLNSFTSYQFPNPFWPQQDPLSRLEFPIDQWFVGVMARYGGAAWSVEAQGWINFTREARSLMQDSDWNDDSNPSQKTIFSESRCRLNRGLLFDVRLDVATSLTAPLNLRPVAGWRCENFNFTTYDGFQAAIDGPSTYLDGDGIEFRQVFYHYYLGGIIRTGWDPGRVWPWLPRVKTDLQFDYALVTASNEDLHLLRSGERVTRENTRGHCWHVATTLSFVFGDAIRARIEGDFKRLLTNGSHRLTNPLFEIDFSFDGSNVWSDQASISAVGEFFF